MHVVTQQPGGQADALGWWYRTTTPPWGQCQGGHGLTRKEKQMNSWLGKGILVVATLVLVLSGITWAAHDDHGCSNATLRGAYGFRVVGQGPDNSVTAVVGMKHFDGAGNLTQVDFAVTDGVPQPGEVNAGAFQFRAGQTGTYKANPACTGSMETHLNAPPVPLGSSTGVIKI